MPNKYTRRAQFIKYGNSILAEVFGDTAPADGDDIVRKLNAHDELLAALHAVVAVYDKVGGPLAVDPAVKGARAAIAKATQE